MSPRILFTGNTSAGSWQIRGAQLSEAIGADSLLKALLPSMGKYDLIVYVKRPCVEIINAIQRSKKLFVWDIVDSWPQPEGNGWNKERATKWLVDCVQTMKPHAVICATEAMQEDLLSRINIPCIALPHHASSWMTVNKIRDEVKTVGYFGREDFLDHWRNEIDAACIKRGWRFLINPQSMDLVDIGVAFRGGKWRGYATDRWKSNVKLANFQASGTPCVLSLENGYTETATGGEYFARTPKELNMCFDWLAPKDTRVEVQKKLLSHNVHISGIAERYKNFLYGLLRS